MQTVQYFMADQQTPGSNPPFDAIYNPSGFDGQVTSDFMRLGGIPAALRKDLIDFSTADFDDFKTNLLNYLKAVYPDDYTNFIESDLGIMLSELFAYMGAILSFKADAIAQENYIATAKTPESITKLLELIGVSLRGPVCAKANAKLTIPLSGSWLDDISSTVVVGSANRVLESVSTRDNLPLAYTLYKMDANGNINIDQEYFQDLTLSGSDSTEVSEGVYDFSSFENLVLLEGKLQTEDGSFSEGTTSHSISVPLPSVIEGSIAVSSGDDFFTEIESIWFASAGHAVFEKQYNDDFSCKLIFGDGTVGKSPTAGAPYIVMYRTGGGLRGNIPQGSITKSKDATRIGVSPPSTGTISVSITNVRAGTGGVDAQSVEEARRMGPMWFATQYRAVTGKDYTTFANKFVSTLGKTGKALAALRDNGSAGNMIDIYVLQKATADHLERAPFEFKNELLTYLNKYRMLTDEITIVDGIVRTLDLAATLYLDKEQKLSSDNVKERVAGLMQTYFSTNTTDFGTPLLLADLQNFLLKDPGVRFLSIDNYSNDVYVDFNEILQLNNIELNVKFV